ncbi:MAG TPA: Flp family type IVb pilin [Sphingomicrobium sp.]|jgi:Flp pilus assembly pilin Flp|nr:Flp family type IVb pilin [Sphingomicrobium sp.]
MSTIGKLLRDDKGVGTVEYALVAMLISVAALSAYANLGSKVQARWSNTYSAVSTHLG